MIESEPQCRFLFRKMPAPTHCKRTTVDTFCSSTLCSSDVHFLFLSSVLQLHCWWIFWMNVVLAVSSFTILGGRGTAKRTAKPACSNDQTRNGLPHLHSSYGFLVASIDSCAVVLWWLLKINLAGSVNCFFFGWTSCVVLSFPHSPRTTKSPLLWVPPFLLTCCSCFVADGYHDARYWAPVQSPVANLGLTILPTWWQWFVPRPNDEWHDAWQIPIPVPRYWARDIRPRLVPTRKNTPVRDDVR